MSRLGPRAPLLLLLGVTFCLNAWGISYGLPPISVRAWDHDEIVPQYVLGSLENGLPSGAWPVKYPTFHYELLAPLYRGTLWLVGGPGTGDAAERETLLFYLTRGLSLLMGTATVLLVHLAGREALDDTAGLLAAALYAFTLPAVFYAKSGNLDAPYMFWFALSLWLYFRLLRFHRLGDYAGFGLATAMAVGTKDQAYGLYLLAPLPLLVALRRHRLASGRPASLRALLLDRRPLVCALAAAGLFVVGHRLLTEPEIFLAHVRRITGPASESFRMFEPGLGGQTENLMLALRNTRFVLGLPALLAALCGLFLVLRERSARARASAGPRFLLGAALLMALSYYASFIAVILYSYDRFFLPIALVLALFGGLALARLLRAASLPPLARMGAVLAVLGVSALRAFAMDLEMVHDSRYAAEDWVAGRADATRVPFTIGDPQRSPRLVAVSWTSVARGTTGPLRAWHPRLVAVNVTDALQSHALGRELWPRLEAGRLGYDVRYRYRYRPPLDVFDPGGTTGSLYFINPEMVVLEHRGDPWMARYAALAGWEMGASHRLALRLREASAHERAECLDRQLLVRDPGDPAAAVGLALDLAAGGGLEEAVAGLGRLAEARPGDAGVELALARLLAQAGGAAEARSAALRADAAAPGAPEVALVLAEADRALGRTTAAFHGLHAATRRAEEAGDRPLLVEVAGALGALGARGSALEALARSLRLAEGEAVAGGKGESGGGVGIAEDVRHEAFRVLDALGRAGVAGRLLAHDRSPVPAARAALVGGVEGGESDPHLGEFRWTHACALALVEDVGGPAVLTVRYRCGREAWRRAWLVPAAGHARFELRCGSDEVETARVALAREAWGGSVFLPVEVVVDPPFRPTDLWPTDDARELGLQLFSLAAERDGSLSESALAAGAGEGRSGSAPD